MCSRHREAGAASYVPARSVAHSTVTPDCYGCLNGSPCSQVCAACECRWSGDPMSPRENCDNAKCQCHQHDAVECENCAAITTDIRRLDMGRGIWNVCGVCLDKWQHDDEDQKSIADLVLERELAS